MWATRPRGNPPSVVRWPTKPGPSPRLRDDDSLGQEPRWNAGRRARPAGRAPRLHSVRWFGPASFGVPLPFFLSAGKEEEAKSPQEIPKRREFRAVRTKTPMHAHRGNGDAHVRCTGRTRSEAKCGTSSWPGIVPRLSTSLELAMFKTWMPGTGATAVRHDFCLRKRTALILLRFRWLRII